MAERIDVTVNGTVYTVEIDKLSSTNGTPIEVRVNGTAYSVRLGKPAQTPVQVARKEPAPATAEAKPQPAAKPAAPATTGEAQRVTAPMPGKILSVAVEVGDQVKEKDTLCTLEAMKMEMAIAAPAAGTVREVRAQAGGSVANGDLLFVIG